MTTNAAGAKTASSLAEQAYLVLEQKLVSLELPPGEVVSEG
jgi:DNA-binding GntR family transcriptional regulator